MNGNTIFSSPFNPPSAVLATVSPAGEGLLQLIRLDDRA